MNIMESNHGIDKESKFPVNGGEEKHLASIFCFRDECIHKKETGNMSKKWYFTGQK